MWNPFKKQPRVTYTYPANGGTDAGTALMRLTMNSILCQKYGLDIITLPGQARGDITVIGREKDIEAFKREKEASPIFG